MGGELFLTVGARQRYCQTLLAVTSLQESDFETAIHNADLLTRFQKTPRWGIVLCDVLKLLLAFANAILT